MPSKPGWITNAAWPGLRHQRSGGGSTGLCSTALLNLIEVALEAATEGLPNVRRQERTCEIESRKPSPPTNASVCIPTEHNNRLMASPLIRRTEDGDEWFHSRYGP